MPNKNDIESKKDIELLVNTFYATIRTDEVLGPIFNGVITNWPEHLSILSNFWETQLFLNKRTYTGNPVEAHVNVDKQTNQTITAEHFGLWLNTWFATIDNLFEGEKAWLAKNRAQKMSTMLFMHMFKSRS